VLSGFASVPERTLVSCSPTPPLPPRHSPRVHNNRLAGTSRDITTNAEVLEQAGALFSRCAVPEFLKHKRNKICSDVSEEPAASIFRVTEIGLEIKQFTLQMEAVRFFKTPDKSYPRRCKTSQDD
jgi:hypothetical protein